MQSGCICAKVVVFGQKNVVFGQSGCNRVKVVLFRRSHCIRAKVFVFGQKWLYSGKVVVIVQK